MLSLTGVDRRRCSRTAGFSVPKITAAMAAVMIATASIDGSGSVMAQQDRAGAGATTGAAQAGAGNANTGAAQPAGGLTPDDAFAGGVERTGTVGQAAAPVGANPNSRAAAGTNRAAGGLGGGLGGGGFGGGGGGGLGAVFGNLFNNNAASGSSDSPPLRTRLRSAIVLPPMAPGAERRATTRATTRLRRSPSLQYNPPGGIATSAGVSIAGPNRYDGVSVEIRDRTAVLTGRVGSERDRRMSQLMMRLEPGVSRIENRLQVSP